MTVAMIFARLFGGDLAFSRDGSGGFPKTKFFEYFNEPDPRIIKAVFSKEMYSSEIPVDARKQSFALMKQGNDYVLSVLKGTVDSEITMSAGWYDGRSWGLINGDITYSDSAINQRTTPIAAQETVTRMTANLLINLGITELVRESIAWEEMSGHFVGKSTTGRDLVIEFQLVNQLPKRAIIIDPVKGGAVAFVDYEYASAFANGELPFRFTRHFGSPTRDIGKAFFVELAQFEWTDDAAKISGLVLDPVVLFHPTRRSFYSNNVTYTINADGRPIKTLTMEEYQASLLHLGSQKRNRSKVLVYFVMGVSVVALLVFVRRSVNHKQPKS